MERLVTTYGSKATIPHRSILSWIIKILMVISVLSVLAISVGWTGFIASDLVEAFPPCALQCNTEEDH